jgi:hypothetical protein
MADETFRTANNDSFQTVDHEVRQFMLGGNRTEAKDYTASGDTDLAQGLILAYNATTDKFIDFDPDGAGAETIPFGLVTVAKTVLDGATAKITVVVAGDVDETIAIAANTAANVNLMRGSHFGVRFVKVRELNGLDN